MAQSDAEEGFKVTDRRRRTSDDEPAAVLELQTTVEGDAAGNLAGLFMMLANSAVFALGEMEDPVTGQRHHDPAQASEIIDLLLLLRTKTEGNRTAEETRVLAELIDDLQARYVEAMKRTG